MRKLQIKHGNPVMKWQFVSVVDYSELNMKAYICPHFPRVLCFLYSFLIFCHGCLFKDNIHSEEESRLLTCIYSFIVFYELKHSLAHLAHSGNGLVVGWTVWSDHLWNRECIKQNILPVKNNYWHTKDNSANKKHSANALLPSYMNY